MRAEPKYKVGDKVIIAGRFRLDNCAFGIASEMYDYVGEEATILSVGWSDGLHAYRYYIDIDETEWSWCENCFDPAERCPNLPEFTPGDIWQLI